MAESTLPSRPPRVCLVAAIARNRVIGRGNALPWHLPEDLKRFKALTLGHPVLMGRKTHESIGKPLPGRRNLVITRNRGYRAAGCEVFHTLDAAIAACRGAESLFVIGGAELYRAALGCADRLEFTEIDADFEGDAYFPEFSMAAWRESGREIHAAAPGRAFRYDYVRYVRAQ